MVSKKSKVKEVDPIQEELVKLAKINNISSEELFAEYQKSYMELNEKGVTQNLERLSMNAVKNLVRKMTKKTEFTPKQKAESVIGFIIGDSGIWDKVQTIITKAQNYAKKQGISAALEAGLINEDNEVLDTREELFGKPNKGYKQPFGKKQHERTRTLDLIGRINGSEVYKYGTIQTNDNQLALGWGKVKFVTPCQTFGIVKEVLPKPLTAEEKETMSPEEIETYENKVGSFKLNSSNAEDTTSIFKAVHEPMDVDAIFMKVIGPQLTEVSGVEEYHVLVSDAWDRRIFVKGMVTWIARDRPSPYGSINMGLMGEDGAEIVIEVPEHLSIDFGENSEIIVIGKTNRGDLRVEGENGGFKYIKGKGEVKINAVGFYKLQGLTTPTGMGSPESLEDEKEIDGWVE